MTSSLYGTKKGDGRPVTAYRLAAGKITATVLDMGGTITALEVEGRNMVLGLADLAAYEASGWWNSLIGRYANRIRGGFSLGGQHYPLRPDANGVTLHGGPDAWGKRLWQVVTASDTALTLRLVSAHGDQGFPGQLTVDVTYTVDKNSLRLDYMATTDAPTPVSLTNHLYFNMGSATVLEQYLELRAGHMTPTDARQIPTGAITSVSGTAFDFREPAVIGTRVDSDAPQMALARGLDHNFVLDKREGELALVARIGNPANNAVLEVLTTEPGLQVYSTNNVKGDARDGDGNVIGPRAGLALETQHFPDSPNKPEFPSTILRPGEEMRSTTIFRFP
jgi:aldose 1-epimerase